MDDVLKSNNTFLFLGVNQIKKIYSLNIRKKIRLI